MLEQALSPRNGLLRRSFAALMLAAVGLLMLLPAPARALQEPPAVKALFDVLRLELQLQPKVGNIRTDDDTIVLDDVVLAEMREDGNDVLTARVKEIRLKGARSDNGLMHYRLIDVDTLTIELVKDKQPVRIVMPAMTFAEASLLPHAEARSPQEKFTSDRLLASVLDIPQIRIELPGVRPIVWTGVKGTWKGDRRTGAGESRIDLGTLPLPLLELARLGKQRTLKLQEALQELGLEKLTLRGEVKMRQSWMPDARMAHTSSLRYGAPEAGELRVELHNLALPLELLQQARKMQREWREQRAPQEQRVPDARAPGSPGTNDAPQAPRMQPGGPLNDPELAMALRRLTLGGLTLQWRDHGLTNRLLAHEARKRGLDVSELIARQLEAVRARLSSALPQDVVLGYLRELSRFLQDPKSLRISLSGANGQPIALANAAMFLIMPQMMLNSVKVEVKANE